jgi:FlaA1/EpsC-like NDP-sugar epimerase
MGASKLLAEKIVRSAAGQIGEDEREEQRFVNVRFGNVLGSRGSVVPLFRRQIEAGGPVTITDRRMTRYFMTIPEASQLVLQAGALAQNGCVYLLDMGEPVRIADLAEDLIRLSGMEPHVDVEVQEVGMRPGEKLYEELTGDGEAAGTSVHEKISVVQGPGLTGGVLENLVADLDEAARDANAAAIVSLLHEHVEGSRLRQVETRA